MINVARQTKRGNQSRLLLGGMSPTRAGFVRCCPRRYFCTADMDCWRIFHLRLSEVDGALALFGRLRADLTNPDLFVFVYVRKEERGRRGR